MQTKNTNNKLRHTGATLLNKQVFLLKPLAEASYYSDKVDYKTYVNIKDKVNQTGDIAFRSLKIDG